MAAGAFSNTELDASIPEIWDLKVEEARYEESVMLPRVSSKSDVVKEKGDKINITIDQRLTVVDVTQATGAFAVQNYIPSTVQLIVDKWKAVPIEVVDMADKQSFYSPESNFPTMAGKAMGETYDTDLLALHSNVTGAQIGSESVPVNFDENAFLPALQRLRKNKIPLKGLTFAVPPEGFYQGIWRMSDLRNANTSGQNQSMLLTADKPDIMRIPIVESTLVATAAGGTVYKAMLFHKTAFAIAMQINNEYEKARATASGRLADILVMHTLYGVKTIRDDHAVVINIAAA